MTIQDLDNAAMSLFDVVLGLVVVGLIVRSLFKKRSRHIPSAEFNSVTISRIIKKG